MAAQRSTVTWVPRDFMPALIRLSLGIMISSTCDLLAHAAFTCDSCLQVQLLADQHGKI